MIYVILGMHKSGTSLISQILHSSGIPMVNAASELSYDKGNKWERESTKDINHQILCSRGLNSLDISSNRTHFSAQAREHMASVVKALSSMHDDWGFKDPRTCLTYSFWQTSLPAHQVIAVYRSPTEVWARYLKWQEARKRRFPPDLLKFIRVWSQHNMLILDALQDNPGNSVLINYSRLMESEDTFRQLEEFVGRPLSDMRKHRLYRGRQNSKKPPRLLEQIGKINAFYDQPPLFDIFYMLEKHEANITDSAVVK